MTPRQKFERPATAHTTVLTSPFAGAPAGARLHISTRRDLDAHIRSIPAGTTLDVPALRNEIAVAHDADSTCPVTTAIHLRTVTRRPRSRRRNSTATANVEEPWTPHRLELVPWPSAPSWQC
jgi:hypothetical protein